MRSTSHEDAERVGMPAAHAPAPTVRFSTDDALRISRNLPRTSVDAAWAMVSYAANRMVADQVRNAHAWGELAGTHSKNLLEASEKMNDGPLRDGLAVAARGCAVLAEGIIAAANQWGRRYGHIAFALPLPEREG